MDQIPLPVAESGEHVRQDEGRGSPDGEGAEGAGPPLGRHRRQVGPLRRHRALQRPHADQHGVQDPRTDLAEGLPVVSSAKPHDS